MVNYLLTGLSGRGLQTGYVALRPHASDVLLDNELPSVLVLFHAGGIRQFDKEHYQ